MSFSGGKPSAAAVPRPTSDQLLQKKTASQRKARVSQTYEQTSVKYVITKETKRESEYRVSSAANSRRLPSQLNLTKSSSTFEGGTSDTIKNGPKKTKDGPGVRTKATGPSDKSKTIPLVTGSMVFPEKAVKMKTRERVTQTVAVDEQSMGEPAGVLHRSKTKKPVPSTLIESKDVFPQKTDKKHRTKTEDHSPTKDPEEKKHHKKPKKHKNHLILPDELGTSKLKKKVLKFDLAQCKVPKAMPDDKAVKPTKTHRSKDNAPTLTDLLKRTEIKLKDDCSKSDLKDLIDGACEQKKKKFAMVFLVNSKLEMEIHEDTPEIIAAADLLLSKLHKLSKYTNDLKEWQQNGFRTYLLDGKNEKALVNVMVKANSLDIPFFATKIEEGPKGTQRVAVIALFGRILKIQGRQIIKF